MKHLFIVILYIFIFMMSCTDMNAQETFVAFDTIKIVQAEYYLPEYTIEDTIISKINIQITPTKQLEDVHFKPGADLLGYLVTTTTGLGLGGSKESNFFLASTIRTNNPKLDWNIDVYTPGYVQKNRERVKNSDGSTSVNTTYTNIFAWQKGAIGYIIETGDTIGWYYVYLEPRKDSVMQRWFQPVFKGKQIPTIYNFKEFALKGEFTGREIELLYNTEENRIYLYEGAMIKGIYQCQKPPKVALKKKNRTVYQPYLLVNEKLNEWERMDELRLAMVGLRMIRAVTNGY
jgi:hypothetical protein